MGSSSSPAVAAAGAAAVTSTDMDAVCSNVAFEKRSMFKAARNIGIEFCVFKCCKMQNIWICHLNLNHLVGTYQVDKLFQLVAVVRLEQEAGSVAVPLEEQLVAVGQLGIDRGQSVLIVCEAIDPESSELAAHLAEVVRSLLERLYDSASFDLCRSQLFLKICHGKKF